MFGPEYLLNKVSPSLLSSFPASLRLEKPNLTEPFGWINHHGLPGTVPEAESRGCVCWLVFHEQLRIIEWPSEPIFSPNLCLCWTMAPEDRNWTSLTSHPPESWPRHGCPPRLCYRALGWRLPLPADPALTLILASLDGQTGPSKNQQGLFWREKSSPQATLGAEGL